MLGQPHQQRRKPVHHACERLKRRHKTCQGFFHAFSSRFGHWRPATHASVHATRPFTTRTRFSCEAMSVPSHGFLDGPCPATSSVLAIVRMPRRAMPGKRRAKGEGGSDRAANCLIAEPQQMQGESGATVPLSDGKDGRMMKGPTSCRSTFEVGVY